MKHIFLIAGVALSFGLGCYSNGLRWEAKLNHLEKTHAIFKQGLEKEVSRVQGDYDNLLQAHILTVEEIDKSLQEKEKVNEKMLEHIAAESTERLRQSQDRVRIYQRQAQAGSAEVERLASHAAELDRSIVEGKRVAAELAATVRLRDSQLIELGSQIKADRAVLEE